MPERGQRTAHRERDRKGDGVLDVVDLAEVEHREQNPHDDERSRAQTPRRRQRGDCEHERGDRAARGPDVEVSLQPARPLRAGECEQPHDERAAEHADQVPGDKECDRAQRAEAPLGPDQAAEQQWGEREVDPGLVDEEHRGER